MISCILVDDDPTMQLVLKKHIGKIPFLRLAASFSNPVDACDYLHREPIDLVFLDVLMPEMNGLEFIKSLSETRSTFVLISSEKDFALQAFDLNVADYLLKPVLFDRFMKAALKGREIAEKQSAQALPPSPPPVAVVSSDFFFVKVNGRHIRIQTEDIAIVEALADYVMLYTSNSQRYIVHSTMKGIQEKLPSNDFVRIHNSYIIRIDKITEIEDNTVTTAGKVLPISRSHLKEVKQRLNFL